MNVADTIKKFGLEQAFDYLYRDPERNLLKIMDWADRFDNGDFAVQRKVIRQAIEDPSHPYHQYILHIVQDVDPEVMKTVAVNLFINASMIGWRKQEVCRAQYQCNIPWAILLDPTSACNLHCTGCWAAEYGNRLNLTFDEIDRIIRQGKELGVYMYIYTGGEPLVRKDDLIRLCEKHSDCVFLCFTNGTLIDESFADEMLPSPWQREAVYRRIRRLRAEKPLFAMDFQNDAEYMGGCIAGGKRYLHINANGDVDPCVFVHYSNANIRSCTLLEALQSPIFMAYYHNMPFNAPALPHAGKPGAAAQDGPGQRSPLHRPPVPGVSRPPVRQVRRLCQALGPGGTAAVGGAKAGIGSLTEYAERRRSLRRFLLFRSGLPGPLGGQEDGPLPCSVHQQA